MEEMYNIFWPNLSNHEVNVAMTVWRTSLNIFCHICFVDRKKCFSLLDCLCQKVILRENLVRTGGMGHRDKESGLLGFIRSSDTLFICCMTLASLFSWLLLLYLWPSCVPAFPFLSPVMSWPWFSDTSLPCAVKVKVIFGKLPLKKKTLLSLASGQISDLEKIVFYLLEC